MSGRLENKVAVVTGAARGIGAAIVELFHREGAEVLATDIDDLPGRAVVSRLGGRCEYLSLDVRREEDWRKGLAHILERWGRLDVLVNDAGISGFPDTPGPYDPEGFDLESWRAVHATNLEGVALGCKHAIRVMKAHQGGSIVNISSRSGVVGTPTAAAYASSKAAVRNHTKSVALYCAQQGYGIRCNSIHPGAILTPMWDPIVGQDTERGSRIREIAEQIPLRRMGVPLDVAFAALYLASDESTYITGTELHVDGGILAGATAQPRAAMSDDAVGGASSISWPMGGAAWGRAGSHCRPKGRHSEESTELLGDRVLGPDHRPRPHVLADQ